MGLVSFYGQHMCAMTAISYIGISSGSTYFHRSYIKIWGQKDGIIELNKTFYFSFNTHWALEFVFIKRSFCCTKLLFVQTLSCSYETQCKSSMHVANMKNPKKLSSLLLNNANASEKWIDWYNLVHHKNRLENIC